MLGSMVCCAPCVHAVQRPKCCLVDWWQQYPRLWTQIRLCHKMRQFLIKSVLLTLSNAYLADMVLIASGVQVLWKIASSYGKVVFGPTILSIEVLFLYLITLKEIKANTLDFLLKIMTRKGNHSQYIFDGKTSLKDVPRVSNNYPEGPDFHPQGTQFIWDSGVSVFPQLKAN